MLPRGSSFRLIARQEKHVKNCKVGWIAARTVDALNERIDANEIIHIPFIGSNRLSRMLSLRSLAQY